MDVTAYLFDVTNTVTEVVAPIELQHTEHEHSIYAQIPGSCTVGDGYALGFLGVDGRFRVFEIIDHTTVEPDGIIEINGIDRAVRELQDEPITDIRPQNVNVRVAATRLLANTRFQLGTVSAENLGSMTAYYESAWDALETMKEAFDCEVVPYYTIDGGIIAGRYVDILDRLGGYRGRLFELGDDMSGVRIKYDESQIKTALYGRGRGVELDNGTEDSSFGRRLTFAEVTWSKAAGDPVDKPYGQEWVGDPDALADFGRDGRHRYGFIVFENEEDPATLLQETWDQLQEVKVPLVSVDATILDLERVSGRSHEVVRLGDDVLLRLPRKQIDISARVVGVIRDYIRPEMTKLTIGNAELTAGGIIKRIQQKIENYSGKSSIWDRASAFDLDGVMDVMNNQIISTSGDWYTDKETGAIMLVSKDGTKAMRLTGTGWQIADGKTGDEWNWRTAATGSGIVADVITAGTLQASLVRILGTARFYWDSGNINIIDPDNTDKIIRIGLYDGTNYGIALSTDGGATWQTALNFDGLKLSASTGTNSDIASAISQSAQDVLDDVADTLEDYSTTTQMESAISLSATGILSAVNTTLQDYALKSEIVQDGAPVRCTTNSGR